MGGKYPSDWGEKGLFGNVKTKLVRGMFLFICAKELNE
jgi:hypothetical protein